MKFLILSVRHFNFKCLVINNFCTYLYDVCSTIAEYLKTPQRKEITNDLIAISADIIENLISVENYINTNLKKLYTDVSRHAVWLI